MPLSIGLDYGTNSVRALIVDCSDGREIATCVVDYPSGDQGILLDPSDHNLARQHPGDYLTGLEASVLGALEQAALDPGFSPQHVVGIGVDGTGSSPLPVTAENVPLGQVPEFSDFVPAVLAGVSNPAEIMRGVCMAGHKAMYAEDWNGLPDVEFLTALDPQLAALRDRLYEKAHDASVAAGKLCPEWADKLGLPEGIPIAIGEMDVHYGAIGCGVKEGTLVKVIGTSTCDCGVVAADKQPADIPGICGIVKGAILPGFYGLEAGQSAVGDIFKWWVEGVCQGDDALHAELTKQAANLRPAESGLLALDWNNGNRTVLVDQQLTGLLLGQTLHTSRAEIYRALIEATAFGARAIIERYREYGVPIERIVCSGGIAEKNPMLMQIYADVTDCEMLVSRSAQSCALGAAIGAAVVAEAHPDYQSAQLAMTGLKDISYQPDPVARATYDALYQIYHTLHDAFGGVTDSANLGPVMKLLLELKQSARTERQLP